MKLLTITKQPAVEATPDYSDGDVIGGLMTLADAVSQIGDGGKVVSAAVHSDADLSTVPIRVLLFSANPSASTITENASFVLHANDKAKLCGVIDLSTRASIGTPDVLFAANANVPFRCAGRDLYAVAIAGGAINLGAVTDLTFVFGIERERQ